MLAFLLDRGDQSLWGRRKKKKVEISSLSSRDVRMTEMEQLGYPDLFF